MLILETKKCKIIFVEKKNPFYNLFMHEHNNGNHCDSFESFVE